MVPLSSLRCLCVPSIASSTPASLIHEFSLSGYIPFQPIAWAQLRRRWAILMHLVCLWTNVPFSYQYIRDLTSWLLVLNDRTNYNSVKRTSIARPRKPLSWQFLLIIRDQNIFGMAAQIILIISVCLLLMYSEDLVAVRNSSIFLTYLSVSDSSSISSRICLLV